MTKAPGFVYNEDDEKETPQTTKSRGGNTGIASFSSANRQVQKDVFPQTEAVKGNPMIHVGTEKYLNRLWMTQYRGYVMNILRRWSDGKLSVQFEKV